VAFLILGLVFANRVAKITLIPNSLLTPLVGLLAIIGAFSYRNQILDVMLMIIFAFIGYIMVKNKFPLPCMVLGVILGNMAESNFHRSVRISGGDLSLFFERPLAIILFIIVLLILFTSFIDVKKLISRYSK